MIEFERLVSDSELEGQSGSFVKVNQKCLKAEINEKKQREKENRVQVSRASKKKCLQEPSSLNKFLSFLKKNFHSDDISYEEIKNG